MAEEKARINGAIFFSISVLLSEPLLNKINMFFPLYIYVLGAIPTLAIVLWEGYVLIRIRAYQVDRIYRAFAEGFTEHARKMEAAIAGKDWDKAESIYIDMQSAEASRP